MNLQKDVLLKNYSNYKIGGSAKFFVEISSVNELKEALQFARPLVQDKIIILGGGTKVLISDEGFDGLVIFNKLGGILRLRSGQVSVGSGVLMKDLLNYCIENSLSGLEWAGGLPGTIGGAVRGNAGSFKGEIKDSVIEVESLDLKTLEEETRNNEDCQFTYRSSIFKSGVGNAEFITKITLSLAPGNKEKIKEEIQQKIDYRNIHQPLDFPSIGSTFKNIPLTSLSKELQKELLEIVKNDPFPVIPATKLLALCGLKGRRVGGAMISEKHPNFILNIENATANDVKKLIEIAKQTVLEKYKLNLEEEIIYLD
jgi:UDP-N-acetylmuramate dehydrogenase